MSTDNRFVSPDNIKAFKPLCGLLHDEESQWHPSHGSAGGDLQPKTTRADESMERRARVILNMSIC